MTEDKVHTVYVRHNYYNGKHYNYTGRAYPVLAKSPEEAESIAKTHKDKIEAHLRTLKTRSGDQKRNLIGKNDRYHLKDEDIHAEKMRPLRMFANAENHHSVIDRTGNFPNKKRNEGVEMNDQTINLIDAIASGDTILSAQLFNDALMSKVADLIDNRRQEVAQEMFEATYVVTHKGNDNFEQFKEPKEYVNHVTKYPRIAKDTAKLLKGKGFKDVTIKKNGKIYTDSNEMSEESEVGQEMFEAHYSSSYQFTHTPGDEESEKKLADLKASVKGTDKRVVLQGRLGKNNPNAHKYSKNAPSPLYKDGKRINADETGKSGAHSHQRIQKADAATHDVYIYDKPVRRGVSDRGPMHLYKEDVIDEAVESKYKPEVGHHKD